MFIYFCAADFPLGGRSVLLALTIFPTFQCSR